MLPMLQAWRGFSHSGINSSCADPLWPFRVELVRRKRQQHAFAIRTFLYQWSRANTAKKSWLFMPLSRRVTARSGHRHKIKPFPAFWTVHNSERHCRYTGQRLDSTMTGGKCSSGTHSAECFVSRWQYSWQTITIPLRLPDPAQINMTQHKWVWHVPIQSLPSSFCAHATAIPEETDTHTPR